MGSGFKCSLDVVHYRLRRSYPAESRPFRSDAVRVCHCFGVGVGPVGRNKSEARNAARRLALDLGGDCLCYSSAALEALAHHRVHLHGFHLLVRHHFATFLFNYTIIRALATDFPFGGHFCALG